MVWSVCDLISAYLAVLVYCGNIMCDKINHQRMLSKYVKVICISKIQSNPCHVDALVALVLGVENRSEAAPGVDTRRGPSWGVDNHGGPALGVDAQSPAPLGVESFDAGKTLGVDALGIDVPGDSCRGPGRRPIIKLVLFSFCRRPETSSCLSTLFRVVLTLNDTAPERPKAIQNRKRLTVMDFFHNFCLSWGVLHSCYARFRLLAQFWPLFCDSCPLCGCDLLHKWVLLRKLICFQ